MEMPKLSTEKQLVEDRKVIKFWVEHCRKLESELQKLKDELVKYRGH